MKAKVHGLCRFLQENKTNDRNTVVSTRLVAKTSSTLRDFPYSSPERKCFDCWIINVTPPGPNQCPHGCISCYAREAMYSNHSEDTLVYSNIPEFVEKELKKLTLCPPISLSNACDPCQDVPELKQEVKRLVEFEACFDGPFLVSSVTSAKARLTAKSPLWISAAHLLNLS